MADTRRVDIVITQLEETTQTDNAGKDEPKTAKAETGTPASSVGKLVDSIVIKDAVNNVVSTIVEHAEYHFEKSWQLSDDYVSQRSFTIAKNIISKSISSAENIFIGFSVGGIAGGLLATAFTGIQTGFEIYKNLDQQNIKIKQMDAQLEYTRIRAGFSTKDESIGGER